MLEERRGEGDERQEREKEGREGQGRPKNCARSLKYHVMLLQRKRLNEVSIRIFSGILLANVIAALRRFCDIIVWTFIFC